jgi:hypothetical protein
VIGLSLLLALSGWITGVTAPLVPLYIVPVAAVVS